MKVLINKILSSHLKQNIMAMYSSRLNLSHLHKTTVGKHWIKIYAPDRGRNFPTTLIMRIGLFFLILFVVLSIIRHYYPGNTHSLLNWVPNFQILDFLVKENHSESLMTETLNSVQKPKDDLSLMTKAASSQNGTQENQENQPVNHFNSEASAMVHHEKPMVENIKRGEQLNEGSYLKVSSHSLKEDFENEPFKLEKKLNANVQITPSEVKEIQTVKTYGSASLGPLEKAQSSESIASTPIVPKSPSTNSKKVVALLQQCDIHFNANRLTTGRGGTAFDCYNKVLALEPNNSSAKKGLKKIEARYQQWLEGSIQQKNWQKARIYLERLRLLNPTALSKFPKGLLEPSSKPQPVSSSKTPVKEKNLTILLAQCEVHLNANRLTTGQGGTAFDCYRQVLAVDPNNQTAKTGLKKIESRYQYWAERALDQGKWQSARQHINRLRHVHPNSPALPKLLKRLKTVKQKWQSSTRLAQKPVSPNRSQQRQWTKSVPTKSLSSKWATPALAKSQSPKRYKPVKESSSPKRSEPASKKSRISKPSKVAKKASSPKRSIKAPKKSGIPKPSKVAKKSSSLKQSKSASKKSQIPKRFKVAQKASSPKWSIKASKKSWTPKRCGDILAQESLGIRPLTSTQRAFKRQYCN
jgi:tetratricopeptide (TPR) repeat protein